MNEWMESAEYKPEVMRNTYILFAIDVISCLELFWFFG